jgi:hypothetical protein
MIDPEPFQPGVLRTPEPAREPFDPHLGPLDDDDDARYLDPVDPRRLEIERRRGHSFDDDEPEHERRRLFRRRHDEED